MALLFLDTETTGLSAADGDRIVEIAIVDVRGRTLVNTLVNPRRPIPRDASRIHGITDRMVERAPALADLWPELERILSGKQVVIYNAAYDRQFFPDRLACTARISCAMLAFAKVYGEWNPRFGDFRWQRLETAAEHVGHTWEGQAHRALADALACRSVWRWLEFQRR